MGDYNEPPNDCLEVTHEGGSNEILLKGKATDQVTVTLKIKSTSDKKVGYITKLVNAGYYIVTPSKGIFDSPAEREIKISRKPLKNNATKMPAEKDRLTICYAMLPDDEPRTDPTKMLKAKHKKILFTLKHVMEEADAGAKPAAPTPEAVVPDAPPAAAPPAASDAPAPPAKEEAKEGGEAPAAKEKSKRDSKKDSKRDSKKDQAPKEG